MIKSHDLTLVDEELLLMYGQRSGFSSTHGEDAVKITKMTTKDFRKPHIISC